eukprot:gnl/MRDRNA2_/MRDRNA2_73251_c0_seq1.p1 gnl/MRDRNA2_/MRDRNA2_73251_c0~~gnl/MRDRNA2_/MRDRNA2_73251_c0_seq1.p1  ORF type:complete len:531 (-),score=79.85 gnl/MRDRNA2_/MRDRNA2_73251_c0_seq1:27-1619(-)
MGFPTKAPNATVGSQSRLIPRLDKLSSISAGTAPHPENGAQIERSQSHGSLLGQSKPVRCHPSTALPLVRGVGRLLQSRLFVARRGEAGTFWWEPLRFVYHSDGSISFRRSGVDIVLDIDWSRPFHAAPRDKQDSGDGLMLYPFHLAYEPPISSENTLPKRYVVLFGAATPGERREWLSILWQKAAVLKTCSATTLAREATLKSHGDLLGWPDARRREVLGEEEHEALKPGAHDIVLQPLLGGTSIWSQESNLSVVQDLYKWYASDPLSQTRMLREHHYFLKYLRRQAEIEDLLKKKEESKAEHTNASPSNGIPQWPPAPPGEDDLTGNDLSPLSSLYNSGKRQPSSSHSSPVRDDGGHGFQVAAQSLPSRFEISAQTSNINVSEQLLVNEQWSGAVIFLPRDTHSFRLTIRLLDSPKTNPVLLGIIPKGTDLHAVNLFDSEGYFLRIDGAHETFCTGNHGESWRSPKRLALKEGSTVAVHFVQSDPKKFGARNICFIGAGPGGQEVLLQPRFPQPVPPADWQPCSSTLH